MASTDLPKLDCAGCRKCCESDTISLMPGDIAAFYKTDLINGKRVLRKGADGKCVYLEKTGCAIYGHQPTMCRAYDCRAHVLMTRAKGRAAAAERSGNPGKYPGYVEGERRLAALGR